MAQTKFLIKVGVVVVRHVNFSRIQLFSATIEPGLMKGDHYKNCKNAIIRFRNFVIKNI